MFNVNDLVSYNNKKHIIRAIEHPRGETLYCVSLPDQQYPRWRVYESKNELAAWVEPVAEKTTFGIGSLSSNAVADDEQYTAAKMQIAALDREIAFEEKLPPNTLRVETPFFGRGVYEIYERLPRSLWDEIKRAGGVEYVSSNWLEDNDEFDVEPGWQYYDEALRVIVKYRPICVEAKRKYIVIQNAAELAAFERKYK